MTSLGPTGVPVAGFCTFVIYCLGAFFDSRSSLGLLDAWSALGRPDARPGLDVGALFDVAHLVLGGVKGHLPVDPGGAGLLAVGLLGLGHGVVVTGVNVVNHLIYSIFLVVLELHMVLSNAESEIGREDTLPHGVHGVLHLVADLCLQIEVVGHHEVIDGGVGTCESRVSSAWFRAGAG